MKPQLQTFVKQKKAIRVLQYNILADGLCSKDKFLDNEESLDFKGRQSAILQELAHYSPDIFTFQEVDSCHYMEWKYLLLKMGYKCSYHLVSLTHGVLIGWKESKFEQLETVQVSLPSLHVKNTCAGLIQKLRFRGVTLLIATCHIYYHPNAIFEKVSQMVYLLSEINKVKNDSKIILTGDFNSTPKGLLYQFLINRSLTEDMKISLKKNASSKYFNGIVPNGAKIICKPVNPDELFKQAHEVTPLLSQLKPAMAPPKFTNLTITFEACLDYIFVSETDFNVIKILKHPKVNFIELPNMKNGIGFPSDHLCIAVDITIKGTVSK